MERFTRYSSESQVSEQFQSQTRPESAQETANLRQDVIFHAKITSVGLPNLVKLS